MKLGGLTMSIKMELASLREKQRTLDGIIHTISAELAEEESKQEAISHKVEQLLRRKSELAVRLCEEQKGELQRQTQKVNEIRADLAHHQEEYSLNNAKIKAYLEDTSFYISEQVKFLVQAFLRYFSEHEDEIGRNVTSKFFLEESKVLMGWKLVPDGHFVIKFNEDVIFKSKDYYFERTIWTETYNESWEDRQIVILDWYVQYAEDFKKIFLATLSENFETENFALVFNENGFTLELL